MNIFTTTPTVVTILVIGCSRVTPIEKEGRRPDSVAQEVSLTDAPDAAANPMEDLRAQFERERATAWGGQAEQEMRNSIATQLQVERDVPSIAPRSIACRESICELVYDIEGDRRAKPVYHVEPIQPSCQSATQFKDGATTQTYYFFNCSK